VGNYCHILFLLLLALAGPLPARAEDAANIYPFAKGTIEKLDPTGQQIILKTTLGTRTFAVNARTYMFRGKEKLTFEKLKIGYPIKLNYSTNETGQAVVRRLKVDVAEPAPPSPEPKAP
jgi:Cu/Ag efflux protein CusF